MTTPFLHVQAEQAVDVGEAGEVSEVSRASIASETSKSSEASKENRTELDGQAKPNAQAKPTPVNEASQFRGKDQVGQTVYHAEIWPGLKLYRKERHILLEAPERMDSLGSAVYGGGMQSLQRFVNIYVDRFYHCEDPERDIRNLLRDWGYPEQGAAGLLTAVQLQHTAIVEEQGADYGVLCCVTAGVSNAARAGVRRTTFPASWTPGTINIMLVVDGRMTPAAMVNAIITATEAKAAALSDLGVRDAEIGLTATGTTTDAVMLGVSQRAKWPLLHAYAGTATDLGGAIGRLVYDAVRESLAAAGGPK
ncbi:adenosylcobinamide amidohydrolase [Paenibacillus bouchesdurhonensis]|uniref:adenosylcobinamide amidohydrolase n=1 Tax=Paenibacillus bouchesdurhonensis TaxID=1870990 RepID=UPI000DA62DAD|nr:adenosylcobinamide amidohydrolase [Paenibacillus bouchesdurhonensis]